MSPVHLRLQEIRKARGLTQAELAEASGVPQPTISRLEKTPAPNVGLHVLERLADALGVKVTALLEQVPALRRR